VGNMILPGFLEGGKRPFTFLPIMNNADDLTQLGKWIADGKVKPIIQSIFLFEDGIKAFEELQTDRTRGKIVVPVQDAAVAK
jgi:NADPH:quinone reductase-like Zn-dependent oxidoreductase